MRLGTLPTAPRPALSPAVLPSKEPPRKGLSPWTLGGYCTSESTSPGRTSAEKEVTALVVVVNPSP